MLPATEKYKQCVACSGIIMDEYHKNDFQFILQVLNSSKYLEEVTGLSKMQNEITDLEVLLLKVLFSRIYIFLFVGMGFGGRRRIFIIIQNVKSACYFCYKLFLFVSYNKYLKIILSIHI